MAPTQPLVPGVCDIGQLGPRWLHPWPLLTWRPETVESSRSYICISRDNNVGMEFCAAVLWKWGSLEFSGATARFLCLSPCEGSPLDCFCLRLVEMEVLGARVCHRAVPFIFLLGLEREIRLMLSPLLFSFAKLYCLSLLCYLCVLQFVCRG